MTPHTPGTYNVGESGRLTVFEPITAANPPAGSESWPRAEVATASRLTLLPPVSASSDVEIAVLSRRLAELLAAAPPDRRAELLAGVNAEIARVLAAAG